MFAIVDIETTGDHALGNGITEIAIVLHNGVEIEGEYQTLINPLIPIQKYVQSLTGITDAMVATAPLFETVAPHIYNLLKDRVFVAHNVNFDYSFVKHYLQSAGYNLDVAKLCTIRLSRKIFPGLPKYGLASLCREFDIHNHGRHRAAGDALATAQLFEILIQHDTSGDLKRMMKRRTSEQYLPPHLHAEKIESLPSSPGVYYFHNKKGKVIYVGKAVNLKKRVTSHFANNKPSAQKQQFLREIYDVTCHVCGSELIASIFESIEIKKLWPVYNQSQKHFERSYGIYLFEDTKGYLRLAVDNKRKSLKPVMSFHLMADAHRMLWKLVNKFSLHPALCFLDISDKNLKGLPGVQEHNLLVQKAVESLKAEQKTYLVRDAGSGYILIEEGKFYGMGTLTEEPAEMDVDQLKSVLTPYPENEVLKAMIRSYTERYPQQVIELQK
jgi:DNA polymerase-3 subunit epsilon